MKLQFYRQSIKMSAAALVSNKMRSFLTMLGIIIGVGAVIVIMSVGAGAQSLILAQFTSLGSNLIGVLPGKSEEKGPPTSVMGIVITTLTYDDALALGDKRNAPHLEAVAAYAKGVITASRKDISYDTNLNGVTANFMDVEGGEVAKGRFFSKDEEKSLSRIAVLGSKVADELFANADPVGQRIKLGKHSFEVIGVMKERGTVAFQNFDDQVIIPLVAAQKVMLGFNHVTMVRAKVDDERYVDESVRDIEATLREHHDITDMSGAIDDFTVRSMAEAMDAITTVTNALSYFLAAMSGLSLLVGGIGIMNIMLVSVTERTREIGLRKAVGANTTDITVQFLVEAVTVTLVGGIIGMAGGSAISFLIAKIAQYLGYSWSYVVTAFSLALAFAVASLVGVVFGLYPARKAAKLDPITALRYE